VTVHVYVTHPQVRIDPAVPVPRWSLSDIGRQRAERAAQLDWAAGIRRIVSSDETKAIETARIFADRLGLAVEIHANMHENDRSATGFLPPDEFERVADQFFASPEASVRGWERAIDAQSRIVRAVEQIGKDDRTKGAIAIVAHGAVGTLLYCHLAGEPIDRRRDQPPNGGGNYYRFTLSPRAAHSWWRAFDTT
jgi:broad specificity phosphatase PhoE